MNKRTIRKLLIGGVVLFWIACILTAFLHPNYSHLSQYISELGAKNAPSNWLMNYFGILPMGLALVLFGIASWENELVNKTTNVLFVISGLLFALLAFFNCDVGCSFQYLSTEAIIHNQLAMFAFLLFLMIELIHLIRTYVKASKLEIPTLIAFVFGVISLYYLISEGIYSDYKGLYQRMYLLSFHFWFLYLISSHKSHASLN
ncbi:MAG: DUF998 domain-containing protein [Fulvivirga sp.]|uniref:DUF998 domain-containing protein n=1 Tax=Fulvivirga sp. TaxID=1931237 RepID=UPI0032EF7DEC